MKITKGRLKQIINEEMSSLNRNPHGGTSLSEAPANQLALQLQNDAKGAAMALLDASKEFAQMPSHEPASSVASFVEKQANLIVDAMVELEQHLVGAEPMAEDLSADAGRAYGELDSAMAQAEKMANELVGIEEYISDPDIAEVAVQSTQGLVAALEASSAAAQQLIGAVDAELTTGDEKSTQLRHMGTPGAKSMPR
jgi:hypothetical protein